VRRKERTEGRKEGGVLLEMVGKYKDVVPVQSIQPVRMFQC
jgi:hypothetical protein